MVEPDGLVRYEIDDLQTPVFGHEHRFEAQLTHRSGIALCLSGGGYRAMLFHLGAIWRLDELGYLPKLAQICSVSGGSITAGLLGHVWDRLDFDGHGSASRVAFRRELVEPLQRLASRTIDVPAFLAGLLLPTVTAASVLERAFREHLFGDATLEHLPAERGGVAPRFVIGATNVQDGALWRFSRETMGDWRVGRVDRPYDVPLARAVAASSAFPPVLSPLAMELGPSRFAPGSGDGWQTEAYTSRVLLMDGGVYDNLALETAYKSSETLLVSDAGMALAIEPAPSTNVFSHGIRASATLMSQVTALRKRQLIASLRNGNRAGAYWGVRSKVAAYEGLGDPITAITRACTERLAAEPTRLRKLSEETQRGLIDWGYAICDTAMRTHVVTGVGRPAALPSGASTLA